MMTSLSLTRELGEDQEEEEEEGKKGLEEEEEEECVEREHMFDKVVTPSDVGKLNRLVIPKQHAERYFPLDSSTNENKGLLLNFEDLTGKSWRFRYSYWNSSQSYVMTKGWSRFVKDKKLDAGDIVSFQRCVGGDSGKKESTRRLFIDWRKRPKVVPDHHQFGHAGSMFPPARFYSFPTTTTTTTSYGLYNHPQMLPRHHVLQGGGYGNYNHQIQRELGYGYFVRSVDQRLNLTAEVADPLVIESVPVMMMHGGAPANHQEDEVNVVVGKRLRLFGVDMECGGESRVTEDESSSSGGSLPRGGGGGGGYSSSSLLQLRLGSSLSPNEDHHHFSKKGKSSLLSFDFDDQ